MGTPDTLTGVPQDVDEFEIGLFQRKGPEVAPLGYSFYVANADAGVRWDGKLLVIHERASRVEPDVDIELTWRAEKHSWTGWYERHGWARHVTLRRPENPQHSTFAGTWIENGEWACVHIAQQADGGFTAWSDQLQIPGRMRFPERLKRPAQTIESYGDIAEAKVTQPGQIDIKLFALTPMCCPRTFRAKNSSDGQTLAGSWIAGPNSSAMPVQWRRIAEDGCVAAASEVP